MKFLLIKSFSGFGDRIEHLTSLIPYANITNRVIVVDWTDHVWCGNEVHKDFSYYMQINNLNGIKTMPLNDFKKYFISKKNSNPLKFLPPFYEQIILRRSDENDTKYRIGDLTDKIIKVVRKESEDIEQDMSILKILRDIYFLNQLKRVESQIWTLYLKTF